MSKKHFGRKISAAVLALSSVLSINFAPLVGAAAETCTWTGGGSDENFSTAANWSGCDGAGVPETVDTIKFVKLVGGGTQTLVNDLGHAVAGVILDPGAETDSTMFEVDTLALTDGAIVESTGSTYGAEMEVTTLSGEGDVIFRDSSTGSGYFTFYTFPTAVSIVGTLTLESGAEIAIRGGDSFADLVVQKGAQANFYPTSGTASFSTPMTLGGGPGTEKTTIAFYCLTEGMGCSGATTWTVSSAINLLGAVQALPYDTATVNITGALSGAGAITKAEYASGILNITPSSNSSPTQTGNIRNAPKTTALTDDKPTEGATVVDNETATLDGKRDFVDVLPGGKLLGTGTAAGGIYIAKGGIIAPGHSPGCINSGDLTLAGTYEFEVGGAVACTGYDQINVTGTVNATGGTLTASIFNNYKATAGEKYVIINNDGTDAVTGTFTGLAEGATFAVGTGGVFRISYVGGTGNDVELTVITAPTVPDTGIEMLTANPVLTLSATIAGAGALMIAARRVRA